MDLPNEALDGPLDTNAEEKTILTEDQIEEEDIKETEEPKIVRKYEIVTLISYLVGIDNSVLDNLYGENYGELLGKLRNSKSAKILRYLCKFRTNLIRNFKNTDKDIRYNLKNIDQMDWFDAENIAQLEKWDIKITLYNSNAQEYTFHVNKLISDHVDDCKKFFPEWVNWKYIRDLFVIPKYNQLEVQKSEFSLYQENKNDYPFRAYLHWTPDGRGNLLNSDGRVLNVIYNQHKDVFTDKSKYQDVSENVKKNIYDFIQESERVVIVVDCENSNVFKLYGVLNNLDNDQFSKIEKIILYDDYHTTCGWDWLEKFTYIPVQHEEVDRVNDRKSLVDIKMTAGVCEAYYKKGIDSFILCSSDSDFWGLISSIEDANFLVMYEHEKCGSTIKKALSSHGIFHCAMDDFYTGNASDMKKKVLLSELEKIIPNIVGKNAMDVTKMLYAKAKIPATEGEIQDFHNKYIKTLQLKINQKGNFEVVITE